MKTLVDILVGLSMYLLFVFGCELLVALEIIEDISVIMSYGYFAMAFSLAAGQKAVSLIWR